MKRFERIVMLLALGLMLTGSCVYDPVFTVRISNPCDKPIEVAIWTGLPGTEDPDERGDEPYILSVPPRDRESWVTVAGAILVVRLDLVGYRVVLTSTRGTGKTETVTLPEDLCTGDQTP